MKGDYRRFLYSLLKIGSIGFGGGSALIPVIEQEIVTKHGLDTKKNIDKDVIVASITPGALPVEIVASIGRRKFGNRGMIAAAVMMALPGALITILMMTLLSVFQEKLLPVIEIASVGISLFIIYLLVNYMVSTIKVCYKESMGRGRKAVFIIVVVFLLVCGKNIYKLFGISRVPVFGLSTIQILALAFFCMFYSRSNYNVRNVMVMLGLGGLYLLGSGRAQVLSVPGLLPAVKIAMFVLAVWGVRQNIKEKKWRYEGEVRKIFSEFWIWLLLILATGVILVAINPGALVFLGKGSLSALLSFGGGDAYLTIADGLFVESGMITEQQYYGQIIPIVNILPGSILCKTLVAVGYEIGFNEAGSVAMGLTFAVAGFISSIAVSCGFFMLIYRLYDSLQTLWAFRMVSRWIRPILSGLLLNIILSLVNQGIRVVTTFI